MECAPGLDKLLSADNLAFIQKGISISVASRDRRLVPSLSRALACVQSEDSTQLRLVLVASQSQDLLRDINAGSAVAVGFTEPSTHRTLQIKGRDARVEPLSNLDREALARSKKAFGHEIGQLGFDDAFNQRFFHAEPHDLVVIAFTPEVVYQQTPGPGAGGVLKPDPSGQAEPGL